MNKYRIWHDMTIQDFDEEPYSWKSDDYSVIEGVDEDDALMNYLDKQGML